ncbi:MAG: diguanylate cyclase (GGDEF)-like protein/PAS domain S-box-containing protein [Sulfurimonas sp.]|jgi:diguanylate cyclase (GGDEF)-like protein/PAS domain S-box-containing protein|uniref:sensor domain-containing diguanylate cyclase n=1 Tax=Sulfurimonas sp. TaxID=2022749 RepID=UPI0039E46340
MKKTTSLENLNTFIELIPDLAFFKNVEGIYTHCNDSFSAYKKLNRADIIGKTAFDLYSHKDATEYVKIDKNVLANSKPLNTIHNFKREDGFFDYFKVKQQVIYDDKKNQLGIFYIAKNITLQKQYEFIYEDTQEILEYITKNDNLSNMLEKIVNTAESRINNSICTILILNETKQNLLLGSAPSLPDYYNEAIHGIAIGEQVGSCGSSTFKKERVIIENIDEHENWQSYLPLTTKANLHACWSEPIFSSENEILGSFAIYNQKPKKPSEFELKLISSYAHLASVAIEKEQNHKKLLSRTQEIERQNILLASLATKDYLTGLYNRSKLDEVLDKQMKHSKRYSNTFGIILLDIDYFKAVNDKYGHQTGDAVLCEFSDLLTACSRETDIVGRWGGEEFLIIVDNINKENIMKLAEKLRLAVDEHEFAFVKHKTASFGITLYSNDDKMNELVSRADKALYKAKHSGRNLVKYL